MTGFGRSELKSGQGRIRVEIKSTNHKFFEISSRLPSHLTEFEDMIRKLVSREVRRGKIMLFVSAPDPAIFSTRLVLNEDLARQVHQNIQKLRKTLRLPEEAASPRAVLAEVLRYPDVLTRDSSSASSGAFAKEISRATAMALDSFDRSRADEGRALEKDLLARLGEISRALSGVERRLPVVARVYRASLSERVKGILPGAELDRDRLTQEVALYVKNSDISEEVTRLKSHIDAMKRALKESGELGRKIDFIGQEMNREANTMGSKSQDVAIANFVIAVKSAIEKIREQSQNVE